MRFTLIIALTCCLEVAVGKHAKRKQAEKKCYEDICQLGKRDVDVDGKIKKLLSERRYVNTNTTKKVMEPAYSVNARSHSIREERFCRCKKITFRPNFDKKTNMVIVNVDQYQQKLSFEVCKTNQTSFASKILNRWRSVQTWCKQLFTNVRLLYLNNEDELEYKATMIPNGCAHMFTKRKRSKREI
ncbi:hypothetical protein MTP99_014585 [Tenebrio molitor]|jgi:hypothetical protein|uniref:uncharacterized protein n=1 Tax=Tenebrio molitor TaxID=7067 RepID=UPI001C3ADB0D|nr:hypothetical protein MTP99_014585 [Tenebrio molitor]CAH1373156.1 unnamed protein product [Tenebrio molitor]